MIDLFYAILVSIALVTVAANEVIYVDNSSPNSTDDKSCWTGGSAKPCATLDLGLHGLKNDKTKKIAIRPGQYMHNDNEIGNFRNLSDVLISVDPYNDSSSQSVSVTCSKAGFSFVYSNDITIRGIDFNGCEQVRNSTSVIGSSYTFAQANVSMYFLYCKNVTMLNVTIRNISGSGVFLYNVVGQTKISSSVIENCASGGVYIEYSYCVPDSQGLECLKNEKSNVDNSYNTDGSIVVVDSRFANNSATLPQNQIDNNVFILPHKGSHSAFGRGGGVSAFFKGNAKKNNIMITNCVFDNNSALWGGGIFAEFQDTASNNNFIVQFSQIKNNKVSQISNSPGSGTGGGGSRVGFIYFNEFQAAGNKILFDNCSFENNEAYFGGGISFYSARQPSMRKGYNDFIVRNCTFFANRARIGSAMDLSAWHPSKDGAVIAPSIINCTFIKNQYTPKMGRLIGIGSVYVDTLHAKFGGEVLFLENSGSALAVTGGYITIDKKCKILFISNTGRNGGAIALLGNTYIITNETSNLTFINNTAIYRGGAIYFYSSGERDLLSSRNCLIQYYNITLTPNSWTSSFLFIGNKASQNNNAIYTSSVLPCLWGGAYGNAAASAKNSSVFCWKNWIYKDNDGKIHDNSKGCHQQINSAPFNFVDNSTIKLNNKQIPGNVPINLTELLEVDNELGEHVTNSSVFIATFTEVDENYKFDSDKAFTYVSHEDLYLFANKNGTVKIRLETLDPIVIQKDVEITFEDCPAGFKIDHKFSCRCVGHYNGYLTCNESGYYSNISKGVWFGDCPAKLSEMTCVGLSPYVLNAATTEDDPKKVCESVNRVGVLCGKCAANYCINANSEEMQCIDEKNSHHQYGWLLYIATEFVPVTIFFVVVFICSKTVTSGPLNSYVFFAQVITTSIKIRAEGMIPLLTRFHEYKYLRYFYEIPYNIWNLDFKEAIPVSYCLGKDLNSLTLLSLGYLTAVYPLMLLIIFIVILTLYNRGISIFVTLFRPIHNFFSRLSQYTGLKQSIPGGIAIFIVISYTKFTLISNLLLSYSPIYNGTGHQQGEVFHFDGSLSYTDPVGVKYKAVASVVIGTFVAIPPLLLLYPSFLGLLYKILNGHPQLGRFYPGPKIQVFFNEFHGCYKDGSNGGIDCRWFSSLYFCLRISMFTLYAQMTKWDQQYLAQTILFLLMAFLFSVLRPYRVEWINNLDTAMFINLAAISTISLYNLQNARLEERIIAGIFALQMMLVFLPLIYCIIFYLKALIYPMIAIGCRKVASYRSIKQQENVQVQNVMTTDGYDGSGLEDSTHVEPFLEFVSNHRKRPVGERRNNQQRSLSWSVRSSQPVRATSSLSPEAKPLLAGHDDLRGTVKNPSYRAKNYSS